MLELFNLLDQNTWNLEEAIESWVAAETKIGRLNEFLDHEVSINDFRDFVENVLNSSLHVLILQSVQRAKNIINTIAINSAEAERGFSLIKSIKFNDNKSHRSSIKFMESNSFSENMAQKESQC